MTQNTRQQAHHRIDEHSRGNGAVRQDIIANRDFRVDQVLVNAMIDSFIMAANDDQVRLVRRIRWPLLA